MKIFHRELAVWLATIAAVFQVVTAYGFDVNGHVQGIVTAVVVFVFGAYTAVKTGGGIVAMVVGIMNALFALFAAFNLDWTAGKQAFWIAAVTAVLGLFTRTQVIAPVGPEVSPPGKLVA